MLGALSPCSCGSCGLLLMLTTTPQRLFCRSDKLIFSFSSIIETFRLVIFVTVSFVESKESSLCDIPLSLLLHLHRPRTVWVVFIRIYGQCCITIVGCYSEKGIKGGACWSIRKENTRKVRLMVVHLESPAECHI